MAFIENDFSPVGANARRGAAPAVWSYTSLEGLAAVKTAGFFNALRDIVEPNDFVMLQTDTGTTAVATIINFLVVPKSPLLTDVTVVVVDFSPA